MIHGFLRLPVMVPDALEIVDDLGEHMHRYVEARLVVNVLFITLDQFRGDSYAAAGHPLVQDADARPDRARGRSSRQHYSQAAPCSPGRAAIYTGTYQMNNRVVANGTPLLRRTSTTSRPRRAPRRL